MAEQDWRTDWQQFVNLMARLYASGSLDSEVSDKYRRQCVSWRGEVAEVAVAVRFDAPGVVMKMLARRRSAFPETGSSWAITSGCR